MLRQVVKQLIKGRPSDLTEKYVECVDFHRALIS